MHEAPAEQVDVQMKDRLSAVFAGIDDGSETGMRQVQRGGRLLRGKHQATKQPFVSNIQQTAVVRLWDEQDVNGRLRMLIAKRNKFVVLKNGLYRDRCAACAASRAEDAWEEKSGG